MPDIKDNGNHWTAYGRVNPFNPCLPFVDARTCVRYTEFSNKPAPFDGSYNWIEPTSRAPAAPGVPRGPLIERASVVLRRPWPRRGGA